VNDHWRDHPLKVYNRETETGHFIGPTLRPEEEEEEEEEEENIDQNFSPAPFVFHSALCTMSRFWKNRLFFI